MLLNSESAELKNKFDEAFRMLKNKKGGQSSLTDIPWYMIIGSPGSGKTTLLSNSGLQFPLFNELGNQAVQGVGGYQELRLVDNSRGSVVGHCWGVIAHKTAIKKPIRLDGITF